VGYLIILVALFALMWLFMIRPQRRRSEAQLAMQDRLRVGDEIITAGGLHATVRAIEGDVLEIEIAPGTIARLDRRAVAALAREDREEEPEVEEEGHVDAAPEPEERQPVSRGES
jgi:preprotein translocase subunit YajC